MVFLRTLRRDGHRFRDYRSSLRFVITGFPVPAIPSWLLEPLWNQFSALLPGRGVGALSRNNLGQHADRAVRLPSAFSAPAHGMPIAQSACSSEGYSKPPLDREEEQGPCGIERFAVGPVRSPVVRMEYPPALEVGNQALDWSADRRQLSVAFLVILAELPPFLLLSGGYESSALISLVADSASGFLHDCICGRLPVSAGVMHFSR